MNTYTFYIEHSNGTTIEWTGLSYKKSRDMHAYTSASQPCDAVRYGWFEEKEPIDFTNLTNVSEGAEV
jgi:hypothetical protein